MFGNQASPEARGQVLRMSGGEEGWGKIRSCPGTHQAEETEVSGTKGQVGLATLTTTAWTGTPLSPCPGPSRQQPALCDREQARPERATSWVPLDGEGQVEEDL